MFAAVSSLAACSGDEGGSGRTGNGAEDRGGGGAAGGTSFPGGAGSFGNVGGAGSGSTPTTMRDGGGAIDPGASECVGEMQTAEAVPVDMFIMLDRSDSMRLLTGTGESKWEAMRTALTAFIQDPASEGLGVGLQYFPLGKPGVPEFCAVDSECGDTGGFCGNRFCVPPPTAATFVPELCFSDQDCPIFSPCEPMGVCELDDTLACFSIGEGGCAEFGDCIPLAGQCSTYATCEEEDYATPAVEIAPLPGNATALVSSLAGSEPIGLTPTPAALQGAIDRAAAHAIANPTHRVFTVLATDGLPTECVPIGVTDVDEAVNAVANIAAAGFASSPSIETYVIGVFAPDDPDPLAKLDRMAAAGGTANAFIVDATQDVAQQLIAALAEIRGGTLDCEFQLPTPPAGQELDYHLVNVEVSTEGEQLELFYVQREEDCGRAEHGWFYDVEPEEGGVPTQIRVCEQTCTTFRQLAGGATVDIRLGCATRGPD
jgi:hypothetical protein